MTSKLFSKLQITVKVSDFICAFSTLNKEVCVPGVMHYRGCNTIATVAICPMIASVKTRKPS